jgi:RNA polymerase sigma-70 factor (ECF subfamily)
MKRDLERRTAEAQFRIVFSHLGAVKAYARRRGSSDAEGLAAEVMTIAWRRLADVPKDDPRPWLYATARNLVFAEARHSARDRAVRMPELVAETLEPRGIDPGLARALRSLSSSDLEALLLVAWEDLTPTQAAKALGIRPVAFRVRLLRARRRLQARLDGAADNDHPASLAPLDAEGT